MDDQAATSAVAVAYDGAGGSDVFYQVRSGAVLTRNFRDGSWSALTVLSGQIVGAPAAVRAGDTLFLAARGMDSGLYVRTRVGGTWEPGWQRLGGILAAAPALSGSTDGRVDVFVRATDDTIRYKTYRPGTGWSAAYTNLGGRSGTAAASAASASGEIKVYVAGMDRVIYETSLSAGGWGGWSSLGGTSYTAPAAVWDATQMQTLVFVRGTNLQLYRGSRTASAWYRGRRLVARLPAELDAEPAFGASRRAARGRLDPHPDQLEGRGTHLRCGLRCRRAGVHQGQFVTLQSLTG